MALKSKSLFFLFISLLMVACGSNVNPNQSKEEKKEISLKYAKGFTINDFGNYKVLEILHKNKIIGTYVLYNKNTSKPSLKNNNYIYIKTPVNKAIVLSSLYVGFLAKLNSTKHIIAIDNANYISNPDVVKAVQNKTITEVAIAGKMNEELALSLKPDLIINYGTGNSQSDKNDKLTALGLPSVYCLDHFEKTPLGRAEWIKFIAYLFEQENFADSLFSETEKKYLTLKDSAQKSIAQPSVLTEIKLSDAWYVPGGNSFMACLIKDAHAKYCWEGDTTVGSLPLSFEQVYDKASGADYWLNVLFCKTKNDILKLDKRYANFKAFKTDAVYNNNLVITPKGGNAYWETGLINPDYILQDMIKIFHPELFKNKTFNYYQKLN